MKWQKKLNKTQLAHIRWLMNGETPTLRGFNETRDWQRKEEEKQGQFGARCRDCEKIERRLA